MLSRKFHSSRRVLYHGILEDGQIGFLFAGSEKRMAGDECYPFSVYRNFYYMTGCETPGAVYMACRCRGEIRETLFLPRADETKEIFEGHMLRPEEARDVYGIDQVRYLDELEGVVEGIMGWCNIHGLWLDLEEKRMGAVDEEHSFAEKMRRSYPFLQIFDSYPLLANVRRVKDEEEIEKHRLACQATTEGVKHMLRHIRPGMTEGQMEAYFDFSLKSGGFGHAFATVAAAGKNACTLHYSANNTVAEDGELILFDLGASCDYYCSDVSRTYPVNGVFTPRQRQLYEIVLKGLEAALDAARPGAVKDDLQKLSKRVMAQELLRAGIIEKEEEIDRYYLHGSGHFIGLYTHDVGEDPKNKLEKNMMFTLEPGLYFPEERIGIRIEDTLLVTEDGVEVLTAGIPKTPEEIEAFMREGR